MTITALTLAAAFAVSSPAHLPEQAPPASRLFVIPSAPRIVNSPDDHKSARQRRRAEEALARR